MPQAAVPGSSSELAREGASELVEHQVDVLGRNLQELGRERHRHQRARQEQLDQVRKLGVAAARFGHPAHQLASEEEPVEILVGNCQRFLKHLAKPFSFS
jgi:hypothetical protein